MTSPARRVRIRRGMGPPCGWVAWVAVALGVAGCAGATRPVAPLVPAAGTVQTGRASWYGHGHHGRLTASGERFDMHALTAAHPSLPFGTRVRVVNLDNARAVEVRVNDRGPTVAGRIVDLSHAAARALGALGAGVFPVRLTVLELPDGAAAGARGTPR
jgi:rare lipoprotein A